MSHVFLQWVFCFSLNKGYRWGVEKPLYEAAACLSSLALLESSP